MSVLGRYFTAQDNYSLELADLHVFPDLTPKVHSNVKIALAHF